jgi:hypothetical protein
MQRMTKLWSNQSGFQWVGPQPIKGIRRPNLLVDIQSYGDSQWAVTSCLWPVTDWKSCGVNKSCASDIRQCLNMPTLYTIYWTHRYRLQRLYITITIIVTIYKSIETIYYIYTNIWTEIFTLSITWTQLITPSWKIRSAVLNKHSFNSRL